MTTATTALNAPDLTKTPPRSPNETLGHFVLLPRILDKCRAVLAGTQGEYDSGCGLDMQFFNYFGVDYETFKAAVAEGKTDDEMLSWVNGRLAGQFDETAILAWGYDARTAGPETPEKKAYFETYRRETAPHRTDITTWFQMLDADEGR